MIGLVLGPKNDLSNTERRKVLLDRSVQFRSFPHATSKVKMLTPLLLFTSFIANIMIGAMTGTLILDKTRRALPRIS